MKTFIGAIVLILVLISNCPAKEATHYAGYLTGSPMGWKDIPYDPTKYTCASYDYPYGTVLCVEHNGKAVLVTVTDRHDYNTDIDLSFQAFVDLVDEWYDQGRINVIITEVK